MVRNRCWALRAITKKLHAFFNGGKAEKDCPQWQGSRGCAQVNWSKFAYLRKSTKKSDFQILKTKGQNKKS